MKIKNPTVEVNGVEIGIVPNSFKFTAGRVRPSKLLRKASKVQRINERWRIKRDAKNQWHVATTMLDGNNVILPARSKKNAKEIAKLYARNNFILAINEHGRACLINEELLEELGNRYE